MSFIRAQPRCGYMKHAVLSTVRRLAGTYRLLEDPLLPEKATQRRIDSFRFFLPPPITVKEETSDVLTSPTEEDTENETAGIKKNTRIHSQLNHRPPTEQEESISQPRQAHFGFGFPHTRRDPFASPRDSLESRSLSSEASRLHGLISGGGCITSETKTR